MDTKYQYVLIGGGVTSVWAAQFIRETDKEGRILIIHDEPHPPYDRPPISKNYLTNDNYTADDAYSKFDDFYPKNSIQLHSAVRAEQIDLSARTVTTQDGKSISYEKLLIATGCSPTALTAPGSDRPGVFVLRYIENAEALRTALQNSRRVVVVGASYLGVEAAASAVTRGLDVTVIEPKSHPWAKFGSEKLGGFIRSALEAKGVKFLLNDEVASIEGSGASGPVTGVTTKSGVNVAADVIITAVGANQNLELAVKAGLEVDEHDGVLVNEFFETSDPNVWAAGDIASFNDIALGKRWHAEHHLNAKWQGQTVGKNLAGKREAYDKVPYFFSDFLDLHMILRGDSQGVKSAAIVGDLDGGEFTELYTDEAGKVRMGISISRDEPKLDPISDTIERLVRDGVSIAGREAEIQAPGFDINSL